MQNKTLEQEVETTPTRRINKRKAAISFFTGLVVGAAAAAIIALGSCGDSSKDTECTECYEQLQQLNCYKIHKLTSDYTCGLYMSGAGGDLCITNSKGEEECCSCNCFYSSAAH